jgi:hypothetical protein
MGGPTMSSLCFKCAQCKDQVPAGGGWAIQKLVNTHIIAGEDERKPVDVEAVLAGKEYLDQLSAAEKFLKVHSNTVLLNSNLGCVR